MNGTVHASADVPVLVSIVGAGPGDPELLTWRAVRRLQGADVVFHDGLVPRAVVRVAAGAEHVAVSRRPGSGCVAPSTVVGLMVAAARRGQRVVRLRAGDPFVLARGAEEALGLAEAEVAFEVVPGLTTASAAPTQAGIPLTHRGLASAFIVVSGHSASAYRPILSGLPPNGLTVVVLMGLGQAAVIAGTLRDWGWRPDTPAAIITNASHADQSIWVGSIDRLTTDAPQPRPGGAGVIVIGEVVRLREQFGTAMFNEKDHARRDRPRPLPEHAGAGGRPYGSH